MQNAEAARPVELQPGSRKVLFIAGAGRSGTSTLAGLMSRVGLHVPQPEVTADETNPRGFGEPAWAVEFHDRMLGRAQVQVADSRPEAWARTGRLCSEPATLAEVSTWLAGHFEGADRPRELVVKDPRLGWFLPLWRRAAQDCGASPVVAAMLRPIAEVVGSKQLYYANTLGSAHLTASWLNMLLHTELDTRDAPRAFVRYADVLGDHRGVVARLGETLGLDAVREADEATWAMLDGFVDPSLRRVGLDWADLALPPRLEELARAAWEQFDALVTSDDAVIRSTLDEVRAAYAVLYAESEAISKSSVVAARTELRLAHRREVERRAASPALGRGLVDRIPHRVRAAVPGPVRRALRRVVKRRT